MPGTLHRQDDVEPERAAQSSGGAQPKRFLKRYRTEVCASSASVMSTILAVSHLY
jgi:hypothetical protein